MLSIIGLAWLQGVFSKLFLLSLHFHHHAFFQHPRAEKRDQPLACNCVAVVLVGQIVNDYFGMMTIMIIIIVAVLPSKHYDGKAGTEVPYCLQILAGIFNEFQDCG